jgi:hypothetical protein
LGAVERRLAH